jgi:hypothetical protein
MVMIRAWIELACTCSLLARCELAGFELRRKADQKIIDSAKQFEYAHF